MMLNYYTLNTSTPALPAELYAWRSAIANLFREQSGWHNHDPDTGRSIHRYPVVQYKLLQNKLGIVALESEIEPMLELIKALPRTFWINNAPKRLDFQRLERHEFQFQVLAKPAVYQCDNWLPMNSEQFQAYSALCRAENLNPGNRQIEYPSLLLYFQQLLSEQIRWHLRGFGCEGIAEQLELTLLSEQLLHHQTTYHRGLQISMMKGVKIVLNINWPLHLGMGTGAAIGYGMLKKTP
ncbi:hypothetical protein [Haliscomenobacter hydrossis]|uniref:Cas6b N-terminal domain-containing protein n=1 Tax=Haliscomenobacter hydrossis (strain ATCC 27775 / DSM 1100 / LMG 10767 / O) TaxID=760192 RepID=F4L830_HALH1|nr:hypothetical protein [Haliscomenobacter hydrossis]AEE54538.1 hypothetical protein Halhy_6723 [Haliscomenobacter hydrossis DSM 1100]